MHTGKLICIITSSAILAGALGSCSMLSNLEMPNVRSALTEYLTAVKDAQYEESAEHVVNEEDAFLLNEMNDTEAGLIAAIQDASEFDYGDIEIDEDSATAQVIFTFPDIGSIADENYSYEEFLEAVGDIEDTIDETIEFELVKEDDVWLIEADSTEEYYNLLMSLIADLEFTNLSEENSLELVNTFMTDIEEGNTGDAVSMLSNTDSELASYLQLAGTMDGFNDIITGYFSRVDYELEVTEITDEYIMVTASGTGPDMQAALDAVLADQDIMVPIAADYIESTLNGSTLNYLTIASNLAGALTEQIAQAGTGPVEVVFKVTEDENGGLVLDLVSSVGFDFEIPDLTTRTDLIVPAVALLLDEGRITFAQFAELTGVNPPN